ncbi:MAG TPA: hypothetical protein VFY85_05745 [Gemmatimonadaceae bacterium]|nr:hypothetical protein [Gemmatimonadaceae bacterium]
MPAVRKALALCIALAACSGQGSREAPAEQVLREAVQGAEQGTDSAARSADSAAASASVTRPAGSCGRPIVDGDGVGSIRIGMSVDTLKSRCVVARDTVERRTEGQLERILVVPFEQDTAVVEVNEGKVWRIEITEPGLRTSNWLGVGTPLSALLDLNGGVQGLVGEGNLFLVSQALCGLSFELSEPRSPSGSWDMARLRTLPKSTVVKRVLVIGCRDQ